VDFIFFVDKFEFVGNWTGEHPLSIRVQEGESYMQLLYRTAVDGSATFTDVSDLQTGAGNNRNRVRFAICYKV